MNTIGIMIVLTTLFSVAVCVWVRKVENAAALKKQTFFFWATVLFAGAFLFRLVLAYGSEGYSADMDTFKAWARITNEVGFKNIYDQDIFLDYPPGYLYVLTFVEKIRLLLGIDAVSPLFSLMLKLPPILADLLCAGALLAITKRKLGNTMGLFAAGAYLLCPAVFINSAQWGQVDSFCTGILLLAVLFLYKDHYVPAAVFLGLGIICKPQILIFTPLFLFFAIKQRAWAKLGVSILTVAATILLVALPFTKNFDYVWLFERYMTTMGSYSYYTVNAYNVWAIFGLNWVSLPTGVAGILLNAIGPVLATGICAFFIFFSKRRDVLFLCPVLLMATMYVFSVKMHERYLYPVMIFLILTAVFTKDRRFWYVFAAFTGVHALQTSYVLHIYGPLKGSFSPNCMETMVQGGLMLAAYVYFLYVAYSSYMLGKTPQKNEKLRDPSAEEGGQQADTLEKPALFRAEPGEKKLVRTDYVLMAVVTLIYAWVGFWNPGLQQSAQTSWVPEEGESVVLKAETPCTTLFYLPGIAPDDAHYAYRVGANVQVHTSDDGTTWTDCGKLEETSVYAWKQFSLPTPGRFIRLTAGDDRVTLNEVGLKVKGKADFATFVVEGLPGAEALHDEAQTVPMYTTYENSTYFDEIYHARTAYEHILQLEPYENTHPPLGKLIISLGIQIFGMNPFGWRFMGILFGVLMLPVLYHLLKQLLGSTLLSAAGTVLFAFDFMHFTQTRIATIDTYAVFFILLMYDAMVVFLRRDLLKDSWMKLLLPLLCSGVFMGLGIASKWTVAYGALGLAVLFFGKLYMSFREYKGDALQWAQLKRRLWMVCGWCVLFFVLVPGGLYFAAFLPMITLPHNVGDMWGSFIRYQTTMFGYHSTLEAEHFFASPWYEWPLDIRPIWYFSNNVCNAQGQASTITSMGNPLLWLTGGAAMLYAGVSWIRNRSQAAAVAAIGFLAVYLPWTLISRLTFIYHYFTAIPFLVLALMFMWSRLLRRPLMQKRLASGFLGVVSVGTVCLWGFVALNLVLFAVFFPVISGTPTSSSTITGLRLLPTWYF